jgi:hypothetical protein
MALLLPHLRPPLLLLHLPVAAGCALTIQELQ